MSLTPVTDAILGRAERLTPASTGTLDAIHLATAFELRDADPGLATIMTYDRQLQHAAGEHGLQVLAPD